MLEVVNTLLYLSESEEESIPKKPVTPINGRVAAKPRAEYVNINQTNNVKIWAKLNLCVKVKYGVCCTDFHKTQNCTMALYGNSVLAQFGQEIWKYGMY
jgi:hypothetical protein